MRQHYVFNFYTICTLSYKDAIMFLFFLFLIQGIFHPAHSAPLLDVDSILDLIFSPASSFLDLGTT